MVAFTAQVREYRDDDVLVLTFPSEHDVAGFRGGAPGQSVSELLRGAIVEVLGVRVKFIAKVEGPGGAAAPVAAPAGPEQGGAAAPAAPDAPPAPGGRAASDATAPAPASASRSTAVGRAPSADAPASARGAEPRAATAPSRAKASTGRAATAPSLATATATVTTDDRETVDRARRLVGDGRDSERPRLRGIRCKRGRSFAPSHGDGSRRARASRRG